MASSYRSGFWSGLTWALWVAAVCGLIFGVWRLESERATVTQETLELQAGKATLYFKDTRDGPLIFVTHGFAGSRQMMQYISRDLARSGMTVLAFDFIGHGRDGRRLSPDVTRIEGTTQQLVDQTKNLVVETRSRLEYQGPIAMIGHSMATDIVIRAAKDLEDVAAIVAISMYSEMITPTFPERLLVLSGSTEHRLRKVGREVIAQLDPTAVEGETVAAAPVLRRAVSVPNTEHVAVLFSTVTFEETRQWLADAFDVDIANDTIASGLPVLAVLICLIVLTWPVARLLKTSTVVYSPLGFRYFLACIMAPIVPSFVATSLFGGGLLGVAAFGNLAVFFLCWGLVTLGALWYFGCRSARPQVAGAALLLFWGLCVFAIALDRYAAAFVPTGPRIALMVCLLPGTLAFALGDRLLLHSAPLWQRVIARLFPVAVLTLCMASDPENLGVSFTVLPVLGLFFLVFGSMATAIEKRTGPETAAVALGVLLAWSIAGSTPLFFG